MGLKIIKGGNKPKPHRAKSKEQSELITCPKCGGSVFNMQVVAPRRRGMRWLKRSGYTSLVCAYCNIEVENDQAERPVIHD